MPLFALLFIQYLGRNDCVARYLRQSLYNIIIAWPANRRRQTTFILDYNGITAVAANHWNTRHYIRNTIYKCVVYHTIHHFVHGPPMILYYYHLHSKLYRRMMCYRGIRFANYRDRTKRNVFKSLTGRYSKSAFAQNWLSVGAPFVGCVQSGVLNAI